MVSGNHFGVLDTDAIKQGFISTEASRGLQDSLSISIMLSPFQGFPNCIIRDTISPLPHMYPALSILTGSNRLAPKRLNF